ncbi:hypothetical protein RclHR1_01090001 [Rhizophagus clarus]|uniref:Uncharacterized protein n=1 Tax=Rhizophagus clarus TaxID=94130 RepID=A0A2Z6Q7D1_9GLOM|nr:hypothetical protein RclHR1_01090001 [Rhizophagus clarus]
MKKGILLSKPAPKIASTSSSTQVTHTSALKSPPSDRFHDVIVNFISGLIKRNPLIIFSSIITTDPSAIDGFLNTYKEQKVPMDKLLQNIHSDDCFPIIAQFLATFLNFFLLDDENQAIFLMDSEIHREWEAYINKQSPNMEDLGNPMHQSDTLMNFDVLDTSSIGSLDNELLVTLPRNITPVPVTPLTKSQKRSAKKTARKEKQKLQLQTPSGLDECVVPTFSTESPGYTPSKFSGSKTVTFNQSTFSPPSTPYKQQLKHGNVIITRYVSQGQEQVQMLNLVVYDIPAKWDNYTLLANLGRWVRSYQSVQGCIRSTSQQGLD